MRCPSSAQPPFQRVAWTLLLPVALGLTACGGRDPMAAGQEHMSKGDYPAAVLEFKNAVQDKPGSREARLALADAYERVGDAANVEQQLRKALDSGGDEAELMPRIAFLMLERNDTEKLIREFKDRRLKSREADSDLRAIVAMALVAQRRVPQAQEHLQGVASTPTVALARAQLLLADGKRAEALAALGGGKPDAKTPWWILRATSRLAGINGKGDLALESIRLAREQAPWNRSLQGEYAEALIGKGQYDEAAKVRDLLKKTAPRYFWTQYIDAVLLTRSNRTDESLSAALRVLDVVPDHLPATLIAASAELQRGENASAERRLSKILVKHPTSLKALSLLAQAQLKLGRGAEAAATVKRGLAQAPEDPELLGQQAEILTAAGQRKEAATILGKLVERRPDDAALMLRLAELKTALGDKAAATQWLEKAASLSKSDAALNDRIVATALRMADLKRARQFADQGAAASPKDPQTRLTLAAVQAAQNDVPAAWASTLAALDLKPTYQPALSALRAMARKPEEKNEVLSRYARALDAKPKEAGTYLDYAELLRHTQDAAGKATPQSVLEQGVAALPDALDLRQALVEQLLRAGQADKALSTAQTGAAAANAPAGAQELLASTYEQMGKREQALEIYGKLAKAHPKRTDWQLKTAQLHQEAGQTSNAISVLRSLVTNQPDEAAGYARLAELVAPTNLSEALSVTKQMASRDALKLPAMVLEGDVLVIGKKYDDAIVQYQKAAKAGALPIAQLRLVSALDRADRKASGDEQLAVALQRFPSHPAVLGFAAQRAQARGEPAKAVEWLRKIVEREPQNPFALNDLAWAQVQARQPQALENARKAAALLPDHPVVLDTLAMAMHLSGKTDEAIATLRKVLTAAPGNQGARLHLAEVLLAKGDRTGAQAAVNELNPARMSAAEKINLQNLNAKLGT